MSPLIELRDLVWQESGKTILNIGNFSVRAGENIALIGKNGAGKSSLVKILALLQKPNSGAVLYRGSPCGLSSLAVRRKISLVFQEPLLLRGTVTDNIALGLKLRGLPAQQISERTDYWLDLLKIKHLAKQNVKNLSGGESQRVNLARAMATEPELLLLDEPFSALDAPSRAGLMQDLCDILKKSNLTVVLITHNITEIPLIAERICVLEQGHIIEEGIPQQVLNYPACAVTASLVEIENNFPGEVVGVNEHTLQVKTALPQVLSLKNIYNFQRGDTVQVLIKPNLIKTGVAQDNKSIPYQVDKISPLHYVYRLTDEALKLTVIVNKETFAEQKLSQGVGTSVLIPPEAMHLIRT